MIRKWSHLHSLLLGAAAGVALTHNAAAVFGAGAGVGALLVGSLLLARRIVRRVDRALPDTSRAGGHPCAGPGCNDVVYGRNRYCSLTCREVAREARMRQRVHAERMAEYGEIPF